MSDLLYCPNITVSSGRSSEKYFEIVNKHNLTYNNYNH
jgi:hypothetical protein